MYNKFPPKKGGGASDPSNPPLPTPLPKGETLMSPLMLRRDGKLWIVYIEGHTMHHGVISREGHSKKDEVK